MHDPSWHGRSNVTWDFENVTSNYMELFGSHVACLVSVAGAKVVPATFEHGEEGLFGQNETDYVGKDPWSKQQLVVGREGGGGSLDTSI